MSRDTYSASSRYQSFHSTPKATALRGLVSHFDTSPPRPDTFFIRPKPRSKRPVRSIRHSLGRFVDFGFQPHSSRKHCLSVPRQPSPNPDCLTEESRHFASKNASLECEAVQEEFRDTPLQFRQFLEQPEQQTFQPRHDSMVGSVYTGFSQPIQVILQRSKRGTDRESRAQLQGRKQSNTYWSLRQSYKAKRLPPINNLVDCSLYELPSSYKKKFKKKRRLGEGRHHSPLLASSAFSHNFKKETRQFSRRLEANLRECQDSRLRNKLKQETKKLLDNVKATEMVTGCTEDYEEYESRLQSLKVSVDSQFQHDLEQYREKMQGMRSELFHEKERKKNHEPILVEPLVGLQSQMQRNFTYDK